MRTASLFSRQLITTAFPASISCNTHYGSHLSESANRKNPLTSDNVMSGHLLHQLRQDPQVQDGLRPREVLEEDWDPPLAGSLLMGTNSRPACTRCRNPTPFLSHNRESSGPLSPIPTSTIPRESSPVRQHSRSFHSVGSHFSEKPPTQFNPVRLTNSAYYRSNTTWDCLLYTSDAADE